MTTEPELDGHCCAEDCPACSGELCMRHTEGCDCETVERHLTPDGRHFVGVREGIFTIMEAGAPRMTDTRQFPIMAVRGKTTSATVPWSFMAPHEVQAIANHGGQSLERLAERGGLSGGEALAVVLDRPWVPVDVELAQAALLALADAATRIQREAVWRHQLGDAVSAEREQALEIIATLGIPDTEDQGGHPVPGATRDTIYALKWVATERDRLRAEVENARGALSSLSLWLSVGMGDDSTTVDSYERRIRQGVEMHERGVAAIYQGRITALEAEVARLRGLVPRTPGTGRQAIIERASHIVTDPRCPGCGGPHLRCECCTTPGF